MVKLWERPSDDGKSFTYYLLYTDEHRKRRQKSLGHADKRKAERQRAKLERELRMGIVEQGPMKLKHLKRIFQLAVDEGQLYENPILRIK